MYENNRLKISKQSIVCFISILPFFIPDILNYKAPLVVTILRCLQLLITFIYFFKHPRVSKLLKYVIGYLLILFCTTVIRHGDLYYFFKDLFNLLGLCLICDYYIQKEDSIRFLKVLANYLIILNVVNFITLILYPNGMYLNNAGMYNNWFLGYKNSHILYILPCIICMIIISLKKNNKISPFIYFFSIIALLYSIKLDAGTSIICLFMVMVYLIFYKKISNIKSLTANKLFIIAFLFFLLIVVFRVQDIFSYIFVNILGKSITFTGRTSIWDYAISKIKESFIIGYGDNSFMYNIRVLSCHNQFLGILYETGIIGLSLYLLMFKELVKKIDKLKNSNVIVSSFKYFIFFYLIIMLMEEYNMRYYMFILIIIYNLSLKKDLINS